MERMAQAKEKLLDRFLAHCESYGQEIEKTIFWRLGAFWYMCLKTENCYLKIFVKIRMDEKVCENTCNII